jgi:hypothetical protein
MLFGSPRLWWSSVQSFDFDSQETVREGRHGRIEGCTDMKRSVFRRWRDGANGSSVGELPWKATHGRKDRFEVIFVNLSGPWLIKHPLFHVNACVKGCRSQRQPTCAFYTRISSPGDVIEPRLHIRWRITRPSVGSNFPRNYFISCPMQRT